jgi:ComF family protein
MEFLAKIKQFFIKYFLNPKWRCLICSKEVFDGKYLCEDCLKSLPYNNGAICNHCGRKLTVNQEFCSTCKGTIINVDYARSVFNYKKPIDSLIFNLKYYNGRYIAPMLANELSYVYFKNLITADFLTFIPMSAKALSKRGYNQSELLANELSKIINLPVYNVSVKVKETSRQAKLSREQRLKNLHDAFKITDKKTVRDKDVLIIDDVTTTGATAEALASKLKNAGARTVKLLTVASVMPRDKY